MLHTSCTNYKTLKDNAQDSYIWLQRQSQIQDIAFREKKKMIMQLKQVKYF